MRLKTLVILATVFLPACASSPLRDDQIVTAAKLQKHYILVHEDGHAFSATTTRDVFLGDRRKPLAAVNDEPCDLRIFGTPRIKHESLDDVVARSVEDGLEADAMRLIEMNAACRERPDCQPQPLRILIFVHGGMNGYRSDFDRMKELLAIPDDPALAARLRDASYYPVFINWNAALGNSLVDDLFFIRFGRRVHPAVGIVTSPLVLVSRMASSVFNAPVAWMHTIQNYRDGLDDDDFGAAEERLTTGERMLDLGNSAVFFVPRALTTPVVEGFGTPAWQVMKRRAQLTTAHRLPRNKCATEGAARTLLKSIQHRLSAQDPTAHEIVPVWTTKDKRTIPAEVTMVGHSMGAIVLNRLLAAVHPLRVDRVVYLAPAAGIDEFEAFILPYLAHHPTTKFSLFTLSRRHEARESHFYVEPRGSLLAWIDNLFERGWTIGQMTHGRTTNVLAYYEVPPSAGDVADIWRRIDFTKGATLAPPFPLKQIDAYVARNVPKAPVQHGDFDEKNVLRDVLCRVDADAFAAGACPPKPMNVATTPPR